MIQKFQICVGWQVWNFVQPQPADNCECISKVLFKHQVKSGCDSKKLVLPSLYPIPKPDRVMQLVFLNSEYFIVCNIVTLSSEPRKQLKSLNLL